MASRGGARRQMSQTPSGPQGERGDGVVTSGDRLLAHAATVLPARARTIGDAHSMADLDADDSENSIDNWLEIDADGLVTVYSGKVELGTGVRTALAQIVAEALDVPFERVTLVMGDTELTPDEGGTTGSKTLQHAGTRLQRIAAEARNILLARAAARYGVPVDELQTRDGVVSVRGDPVRSITYARIGRRALRSASDRTGAADAALSIHHRREVHLPDRSLRQAHGRRKLHPRSPARWDAARPRTQTICADHERRRWRDRVAH